MKVNLIFERRVRIKVLSLILLGIVFSRFSNLSAQVSFGKSEKINEEWKFNLGDTPDAKSVEFDTSRWRTLDLPHDWSIEFPVNQRLFSCTGYLPGGIGWYRKIVNIPQGNTDDRVYLYFEGVYNRSEVFVNGHSVGKRPNGYVSFMYDVTPYVEAGNNSDMSNYRDNVHRVFHGRLLAYIQATGGTDEIKVRFTAPWLKSIEVKF